MPHLVSRRQRGRVTTPGFYCEGRTMPIEHAD
jgi:hypothetical protein